MAKLYNLARVETTTTGSGTMTLGDAVIGCLTFANAGVQDGEVVSYTILDSNSTESGHGTYASAGPTLARTTIYSSTNSGSAISLSGNAQVAITVLAEDLTINQTGGIVQVELYRSTLAEAGNFDTDGTDITGYDHLQINLLVRGDVSAGFDNVYLFFNNDTTAGNYFFQQILFYDGNTSGSGEGDIPFIGQISAASAQAGCYGSIQTFVPNYGGSHNKNSATQFGYRSSATQAPTGKAHVDWESTAAITRITIQPDGYATNKFVAGSFCQIIGIKTVS